MTDFDACKPIHRVMNPQNNKPMHKMIISRETRYRLYRLYGKPNVVAALNYRRNSLKATAIRDVARREGGVEVII